jgi:hypothetical protein
MLELQDERYSNNINYKSLMKQPEIELKYARWHYCSLATKACTPGKELSKFNLAGNHVPVDWT